jgi:beta-lactamase regulating signal transducer with metallopeptidase domain/Leucine-rich repeat (LRR) protein
MIRELFLSDFPLSSCVWQSTIFLVVGLVSSFILRHRSSRAHQVLFLAMMAAVIVPIMSILVKHYELGMFVAEPVVIQSRAEDVGRVGNYGAPGIISAENIEHKPGTIEKDLPSAMAGSESARFPWRSVVLYGWIAASLILAARLLVTFVLGVRLLGRALPLQCEKIKEAVHLAKAKLGIDKDVKVRSSRGVRSPVIWCWRRKPVLLVPSAAGQFDNGIDWTGVLCHELAHYKRRDHISGLLAELAVCILPWNPLLWWAKSRLVRLSEQACDDWVVASGQPGTDYAESLLDLTPQGQMAFVPAVVSSKRGLAGRIRRILKDNCGNPQTGALWALAVGIVAICITVGVAFAQTRPNKTADKVVNFPADRSVGQLSVQDVTRVRRITDWFHWGDPTEWEYLCEAKGDVHVPDGKRLSLTVNKTGGRDLSWLTQLRSDDLYRVILQALSTDPVKPSDGCMPHIARLTGLKCLHLGMSGVTDAGMKYIRNLKSLEYLHLPDRVTDRSLAYVAELPLLKGLYIGAIGGSQVTNAGLRHLSKLTSLEELYLKGERMGDAGLAYLRDLPRLEYLCLYGSHFTDKGMVHLKNIPNLKILSFHQNLCRITDAGLVHISDMPKLEILCLHAMSDITDNGLANLTKLRSLKKLQIGSSQVTDKGLSYLSQIKTLERLDLPQRDQRITDIGFAHLGKLPNLKILHVSRAHYADPKKNKEYYTDKGLAELAKCRSLEELSIGSIGITDAGMEHIAKLTNLKMLNLFGCDNVTNAGLAKLTALKSLRNLYIHDANLSIAGLNSLKPMPNLTNLKVSGIKRDGTVLDISGLTAMEDLSLRFRSRSQDAFVDADLMSLANLKKLKWLQIGPRNYTDKGIAYLVSLTNMERLGIGGAGLTDEGLKYLTNMKKLDHLSILGRFDSNKRTFINGGNITDKGLREFEKIKSLRFLNIYTDSKLSPAAIQHLRRELPNLFYLKINGRDSLYPPRRTAPLR